MGLDEKGRIDTQALAIAAGEDAEGFSIQWGGRGRREWRQRPGIRAPYLMRSAKGTNATARSIQRPTSLDLERQLAPVSAVDGWVPTRRRCADG